MNEQSEELRMKALLHKQQVQHAVIIPAPNLENQHQTFQQAWDAASRVSYNGHLSPAVYTDMLERLGRVEKNIRRTARKLSEQGHDGEGHFVGAKVPLKLSSIFEAVQNSAGNDDLAAAITSGFFEVSSRYDFDKNSGAFIHHVPNV